MQRTCTFPSRSLRDVPDLNLKSWGRQGNSFFASRGERFSDFAKHSLPSVYFSYSLAHSFSTISPTSPRDPLVWTPDSTSSAVSLPLFHPFSACSSRQQLLGAVRSFFLERWQPVFERTNHNKGCSVESGLSPSRLRRRKSAGSLRLGSIPIPVAALVKENNRLYHRPLPRK